VLATPPEQAGGLHSEVAHLRGTRHTDTNCQLQLAAASRVTSD
jgi:hypothetical protein